MGFEILIEYSLEPWYAGRCNKCNRVLRKSGHKKNDVSLIHKGYGLCPKCYWESRKEKEIPYRPLIEKDSETLICSKCNRTLPVRKMKHRSNRPTRVCKMCSKLLERYKITYLDYKKMLDECGYRCMICETLIEGVEDSGKVKAVVDHDHTTGKIRGILCSLCNLGLGQLKKTVKPGQVQEYLDNKIEVPHDKCYCPKCRVRRDGTGLSCVQVDYLCELSGNRCWICSDEFETSPFIDHDHTCCGPRRRYTCFSCIRGVLCGRCNSMLGMFEESSLRISRALKYLGDKY